MRSCRNGVLKQVEEAIHHAAQRAFLMMAISCSTLAHSSDVSDAELRIIARVYNYSQVPPSSLAKVKRDAGAIFHKAGVVIAWVDCPLGEPDEQTSEACLQPALPTHLVLRILADGPKWKLRFPPEVFGFAVPEPGAGHAFLASVYYDRIHDIARVNNVDAAVLLGPAIAHEIGHLLLPSRRHARRGVLAGVWSKEQIRLAARGGLEFTEEECALMRPNVAVRNCELSFRLGFSKSK